MTPSAPPSTSVAPTPAAPASSAPPADSSTPVPSGTAKSDDPYFTSEGFGDLRIGQKVSAKSTTAGFNESACDGGGAITLLPKVGTEEDVNIVTEDRTLDTPVVAIVTYKDTFASKSGIRVGDTLDDLKRTYGDKLEDVTSKDGPKGLYGVSGQAGLVIFQLKTDKIGAIGLVEKSDKPVSFIATDALSPCGQG